MGIISGMWRSRWAAVGAAVAVTLGAGGLYSVRAATAPSTFVAIAPVRVLDTRLGGFGGSLTTATPRLLDVTGTISTVGADGTTVTPGTPVPDGTTAIVANITAVFPTTAGFVSARPGTATGTPTTSNINFTAGGVVAPNSVTVEVPTTGAQAGQIQLWFQGTTPTATTDVLVDVVGYYQPGGTGPRGVSAWDTIPSGQTVIGEVAWDGSSANADTDGTSVALPALAPAPLTRDVVNFAGTDSKTADDDPTCTGTATNPTAPPGKVCLYLSNGRNIANMQGEVGSLPDTGFLVVWSPGAVGVDTFFFMTWAYTAP